MYCRSEDPSVESGSSKSAVSQQQVNSKARHGKAKQARQCTEMLECRLCWLHLEPLTHQVFVPSSRRRLGKCADENDYALSSPA
jgi:hypothetical protein